MPLGGGEKGKDSSDDNDVLFNEHVEESQTVGTPNESLSQLSSEQEVQKGKISSGAIEQLSENIEQYMDLVDDGQYTDGEAQLISQELISSFSRFFSHSIVFKLLKKKKWEQKFRDQHFDSQIFKIQPLNMIGENFCSNRAQNACLQYPRWHPVREQNIKQCEEIEYRTSAMLNLLNAQQPILIEELANSVLLVEKIIQASRGKIQVELTYENCAFLLATGLMMTQKCWKDTHRANSRWAQIIGVNVQMLNSFECEMFEALDFDVIVNEDEFSVAVSKLKSLVIPED
ncbi:MAG: hypothetical protein EZS28_003430 [Streblomastix strix]|uniref:Uncharacterized protein n=1 Tax=Streblomastix strix TaxID=222440 RepID=A0A5J4X147_9EUKA|nr:MAG: hypothetical protein EZS28_003430 [Streblomastix strix]